MLSLYIFNIVKFIAFGGICAAQKSLLISESPGLQLVEATANWTSIGEVFLDCRPAVHRSALV